MNAERSRGAAMLGLRAYLQEQGLVLCRAPDTTFPLDGERELDALVGIVDVVHESTEAVAEWDDETTGVTPPERLAELRLTCAGGCGVGGGET